MLKKCKCGCSDIRLCVITRITNNGKKRFEKFSHYCPNCGEESEQCSVEYPVEMTVKDYIPWRNTVINASKKAWNSKMCKKELKFELASKLKICFGGIKGLKTKHLQGYDFEQKEGSLK